VFRDGKLVDEPSDIRKYWTDDLVTFVLGCSFSFELPILQAGIRLRHIENDTTVPMFRSSIDCVPAGRFKGKMVVSMRPFTPAEAIGIKDIHKPDLGDPAEIAPGELPVFWACGVTPQVVIEQARPPICITHKPGSMLITDRKNASLAAL
jgi:uncharacterized protein YcsI (UPF0317 family)